MSFAVEANSLLEGHWPPWALDTIFYFNDIILTNTWVSCKRLLFFPYDLVSSIAFPARYFYDSHHFFGELISARNRFSRALATYFFPIPNVIND